tara:strand:+ start:2062 stop:2403 length:342 start_codon:yes stop_codon:yes gene_type:complete
MNRREKQFQQELKRIRVWDSTRYSLNQACHEIQKIKGIDPTALEAGVNNLIKQGYYEPVHGYESVELTGGGRPNLGKKLLTCGCLHPPGSSGVCLFGACINITKDKWIITINI